MLAALDCEIYDASQRLSVGAIQKHRSIYELVGISVIIRRGSSEFLSADRGEPGYGIRTIPPVSCLSLDEELITKAVLSGSREANQT